MLEFIRPSNYLELLEACFRCLGLHVYGTAYADRRIASTRKMERTFFSETLSKDNWYWVDVRKDIRLYDDY